MSALLDVEELEVTFGGRTAAVRGASFRVEKGETHCLVGESGCGKSVTALAVMSLLARGGAAFGEAHELCRHRSRCRCRTARWRGCAATAWR